MHTKPSLVYLKFLHLTKAVNDLPQFPSLDPIEERLLKHFASAWYLGKKLTVLETMSALPEISPSTIHRRLTTLRKKGLIGLDVDRIDRRIKYIVHTDLSNSYFTHLGQCLSNASGT